MNANRAGRLLRLWLFRSVFGLGILGLVMLLAPPRWYVTWLSGTWQDPREGVLVVLAGDSIDKEMLGLSSYWRSVYAVWAWRESNYNHVVLSGNRDATLPMQDFLVSQGVPQEQILIEGESNSTHENAGNFAGLREELPGPYTLLTSDYHMLRARRSFAAAGVEVQTRPVPDAGKRFNTWSQRIPVCWELAVETVKIGYYWAKGWI